ncbi:pyrethroid hydrolase Ces2a-like [Amphibalanus amphitrite]|uniref:pyrethroid hydrolase Ces2a-like n=1 Tax=Amphibalanus amphitrite TaxID=1232801 RepID=UPI001C909968|nr:pyrethroid hydrolase Ces2a-like [Amphibalanus amphitrite]XP_043240491.1 pyrethroid hydrolase Ces2a-like [Amphibalanus amphitrite]
MRLLLCTALLAAAVSAAGHIAHGYRPLVATREGRVKGVMDRSAGGHLFYCFKGIPYAQPPLRHLRFQAPQRHAGWRGIRDGIDHGNRCLQFDHLNNFTRVGDEDCLFVNVYSRQLPGQESSLTGLPVLVLIHGGGFFFGSGDADEYGPHYFMDEPVVLVTFNYRLGAFGFFSTHDNAAPGNYGLLDQVVLLHWVQDNIANFGGDPKSVTIFGQAAGGSSVSLQVLSPLTKDLFHHAISQSGMSFSTFAARDSRKGSEKKLSKQLGCTKPDGRISVNCIRSVSSDVFMDALDAIGEGSMPGFMPRVDRESPFPFLPDEPRALLESGKFNIVPWLSGMTSMEGAFFLPIRLQTESFVKGVTKKTIAHWAPFIALIGESEYSILDCGADLVNETLKVLNFYAPVNTTVSSEVLATALSDRFYVNEISEEIRLASTHAPLYKYVLDHTGPGRLVNNVALPSPPNLRWPIPEAGVSHGDDLRYLFSTDNLPRERPGSPGYAMTRFMVNLWTNFARTGQPRSDILLLPDWPIYTEQYQRHMRLNSQPALGERLFEERVNFWQTVAINEQWRHLPVKTANGC